MYDLAFKIRDALAVFYYVNYGSVALCEYLESINYLPAKVDDDDALDTLLDEGT